MWQLRLSDLTDAEKEVGAIIIGSLDKDGYLPLQLDEIAFLANTWPDVAIVERVLRASRSSIRRASPRATLSECLLIQLRQLGMNDDSLPARIVRDHLPMLESRRFDRLARELGVTIEQVAEATKLVVRARAEAGTRLQRRRHALRHARTSTCTRWATSTSSR